MIFPLFGLHLTLLIIDLPDALHGTWRADSYTISSAPGKVYEFLPCGEDDLFTFGKDGTFQVETNGQLETTQIHCTNKTFDASTYSLFDPTEFELAPNTLNIRDGYLGLYSVINDGVLRENEEEATPKTYTIVESNDRDELVVSIRSSDFLNELFYEFVMRRAPHPCVLLHVDARDTIFTGLYLAHSASRWVNVQDGTLAVVNCKGRLKDEHNECGDGTTRWRGWYISGWPQYWYHTYTEIPTTFPILIPFNGLEAAANVTCVAASRDDITDESYSALGIQSTVADSVVINGVQHTVQKGMPFPFPLRDAFGRQRVRMLPYVVETLDGCAARCAEASTPCIAFSYGGPAGRCMLSYEHPSIKFYNIGFSEPNRDFPQYSGFLTYWPGKPVSVGKAEVINVWGANACCSQDCSISYSDLCAAPPAPLWSPVEPS